MGRLTRRISPISWSGAPALTFQQGVQDQFDLGNYLRNTQGKTVTYAVVGSLPAGVSLVGRFVSYDGNGAAASSSVTFTATVPGWTVTSPSATCTIQTSTNPVNTPPYWDASTPAGFTIQQSASVGTIVADFANYARDDEGDEITYTITGLPSFLQAQGSRVVVSSSVPTTTDSYSVQVSLTEQTTTTGDLPTLAVSSSTGAWTFGQPIKKQAAEWLRAVDPNTNDTLPNVQVEIRNRWSDNSAKFAVLSGWNTGSAKLVPAASNPYTATPIATTALNGTTAQIDFGAASVSWSGADWNSPFRTITSGPVMSSWVYRKPIPGDSHLVGWLEVRRYSNGQVEVLPWIENGYLNVAGPATKSGRAKFTLNGSLKYDSINDDNFTTGYGVTVVSGGSVNIAPRARIVLLSGGTLAHWSSGAPVTPSYDKAYFTATKMVPAYLPTSISEAALAALTQRYSPMREAYLDVAGSPGYSSSIGLVTNTSAMFLVSNDQRAYAAMMAEGLSTASHALHYRDETTNRPLVFASYPGLSINSGTSAPPNPAESAPYRYSTSHHPAAAAIPYLVSGWNWFIEEMQFQVTLHYLATTYTQRRSANYLFSSSTAGWGLAGQGGTRASAWQWRTCAMVACFTPDSDSYRTQFFTVLDYNATKWRQIHDLNFLPRDPYYPTGANNLGVHAEFQTSEISNPTGSAFAPGLWMNHFFAASVGWTWDMELLTNTTDLQWLRDFYYTCTVGSLGPDGIGNWNYRRGVADQTKVGVYIGDGLNNWYASWGDAYAANGGNGLPFGLKSTWDAIDGTTNLYFHDGGILNQAQTNQWAEIRPALAYAVDHGYPGALEAYQRVTSAANWSAALNAPYPAGDTNVPVWAIKPRTQ